MTDNPEKGVRATPQRIFLQDRKNLSVNAVKDVISFDENSAVLATEYGDLLIDGEGLKMLRLELGEGEIALEGKINGMIFSSQSSGKKRKRLL